MERYTFKSKESKGRFFFKVKRVSLLLFFQFEHCLGGYREKSSRRKKNGIYKIPTKTNSLPESSILENSYFKLSIQKSEYTHKYNKKDVL